MRTRLLRDFIFRRTSARLMHVKLEIPRVFTPSEQEYVDRAGRQGRRSMTERTALGERS